jgi:hypothetical protein
MRQRHGAGAEKDGLLDVGCSCPGLCDDAEQGSRQAHVWGQRERRQTKTDKDTAQLYPQASQGHCSGGGGYGDRRRREGCRRQRRGCARAMCMCPASCIRQTNTLKIFSVQQHQHRLRCLSAAPPPAAVCPAAPASLHLPFRYPIHTPRHHERSHQLERYVCLPRRRPPEPTPPLSSEAHPGASLPMLTLLVSSRPGRLPDCQLVLGGEFALSARRAPVCSAPDVKRRGCHRLTACARISLYSHTRQLYCLEHGIQPDGYLTEERKAKNDDHGFSTFFSETGTCRCPCRRPYRCCLPTLDSTANAPQARASMSPAPSTPTWSPTSSMRSAPAPTALCSTQST